jgi:L,D-transpeptidase catalytic domain
MKLRLLPVIAIVIGAGAVVFAVVLLAGGGDKDATGPEPRGGIAPGDAPLVKAPAARHHHPVPTLPNRPRRGPHFEILAVQGGARVPLLSSPNGKLVRALGPQTEFGSPRVLAVAAQRGSWLGVETPLRPDGVLGWVRFDRTKFRRYWTRYSLRINRTDRILELRYGTRLLGRYTVTVGAPGSVTPRGRFAITDALDFGASPFYGCCALALSGRQEHLPVGWLGGDRIAIHGTPGPVGEAASHGCIRATDAAMHTLFRRVPLGTPVFVVD